MRSRAFGAVMARREKCPTWIVLTGGYNLSNLVGCAAKINGPVRT